MEKLLYKELSFKLDEINISDVVNFILEHYKLSAKDELIIINVGTDKCVGDSFAPMLGSYMEEHNMSIKFYGTLDDPIHAKNFREKIDYIDKHHENAFVIVIDACLCDDECDIGKVYVRNKAISPRKGLRSSLPSIGDISILYIVNEEGYNPFFQLNNVDIKDINKGVEEIYKIIEKLEMLM